MSHLVFQEMDLKGAFRCVAADPARAPAFACMIEEFIVVDLRLQFGWRGSPGWFGLVAGAIEHAQCNTTRESAVFTPSGLRAVEHIKVEPPTGKQTAQVPPQCVVPEVEGEGGRAVRMTEGDVSLCRSRWRLPTTSC